MLEEKLAEKSSGEEMEVRLGYEEGYKQELQNVFDEKEDINVVRHYDAITTFHLTTDRCGISALSNLGYVDSVGPTPEPELHNWVETFSGGDDEQEVNDTETDDTDSDSDDT